MEVWWGQNIIPVHLMLLLLLWFMCACLRVCFKRDSHPHSLLRRLKEMWPWCQIASFENKFIKQYFSFKFFKRSIYPWKKNIAKQKVIFSSHFNIRLTLLCLAKVLHFWKNVLLMIELSIVVRYDLYYLISGEKSPKNMFENNIFKSFLLKFFFSQTIYKLLSLTH